MSDQGKANYGGYRAAAMGRSLVSGDPLPEWDDLSYQIKLAWDAGACSVELWLAEAPVDEDAPGSTNDLRAVEAERDKAYTERARLVAFLARLYPAEIRDAGSDWAIVLIDTPAGQMSWHLSREDRELFHHVDWSNAVGSVKWDGHTTEQKYERLAELGRTVSAAGHDEPGEPKAAERYALVEQMGHRATVAAVRETTFCGEPMLEVTNLRTGSVHIVSPKSLYEVSWLTEEDARQRAKPWTAAAITAGSAIAWGAGDDQDEPSPNIADHPDNCVCPGCRSARDEGDCQREKAEEGNRVGHAHDGPDDDRDHHGDEDDQ